MLRPFEHVAFSTNIKGTHHLQGNVQVYNVRIPVWGSVFFLRVPPFLFLRFEAETKRNTLTCSVFFGGGP